MQVWAILYPNLVPRILYPEQTTLERGCLVPEDDTGQVYPGDGYSRAVALERLRGRMPHGRSFCSRFCA